MASKISALNGGREAVSQGKLRHTASAKATSKATPKPKMPTKQGQFGSSFQMGTTKHPVGGSPSYLQGK